MQEWQIVVIVLSGLILFFIISYWISMHFLFKIMFKRMKKEVLLTDIDLSKTHYKPFMNMVIKNMNIFSMIPYYKVSITSLDGLKLYGRYYKNGDSKKTLVFFHGYHADPLNNVNTPGLKFLKDGYNLLLITERAHGNSEGKYITFGVKESEDAILWLDFLNKEYSPEDIVLWGVSMGCATIEMVSDKLPINVKALILDCGFTGAYEEVYYSIQRKLRINPRLTMVFMSLYAKIHGFTLEKSKAKYALRNCHTPSFFIHGKNDVLVPLSMGNENYNACGAKKEQVTIDASHAVSIYVGYDEIMKKLDAFLSEYVK